MINQNVYSSILKQIGQTATLIAVSKTKPIEAIQELYDVGHRDFGENKVQELLSKIDQCTKDIRWHLIGPLQRNKVNKIVGNVALIHSVSSENLANKINSRAQHLDCIQDVLIQVNISLEEQKNGILPDDLISFFDNVKDLNHIRIRGLMTIGKNTRNEEETRQSFDQMKSLFDNINAQFQLEMDILSMGMSADYKIALEAGSTMIRVGSAIFGERE